MSSVAPPKAFFVYGTLRPDDYREQSYRASFLEGMTWFKAYITGAKLYFDQYPVVALENDDDEADDGTTDARSSTTSGGSLVVKGFVCFFEGDDDDGKKFQSRLLLADKIEGYPNYYQRAVVDATLSEAQNKQLVRCFVYYRSDFDKKVHIPSGDWLDFTSPGEAEQSSSQEKVLVFGYGSNGTKQLRGRLKNPNLVCRRAIALDYCRAFCLRSPRWAGRSEEVSGVATLIARQGEKTFGSASSLTKAELARLDGFEGGYNRVEITIQIFDEENNNNPINAKAFCYLAKLSHWQVTPSEQYLNACHVHLREYWDMEQESITMRGFDQEGDLFTAKEWVHPGVRALSLEALCVEVNALKTGESWEMPKSIGEVVLKLNSVGIKTTSQLRETLFSEGDNTLNDLFISRGHAPLEQEILDIFTKLLE